MPPKSEETVRISPWVLFNSFLSYHNTQPIDNKPQFNTPRKEKE
jgi:hypothetical protein